MHLVEQQPADTLRVTGVRVTSASVASRDDITAVRSQRALELEREIENLSERLKNLRQELAAELRSMPGGTDSMCEKSQAEPLAKVDRYSSPAAKIALFRSLFAGRGDAYAVRWTSSRTGRSGWSPAVRGGYYSDTKTDADLLPLDDGVIARHLTGNDAVASSGRDFHVGLYPMLRDDTCRLLACDFDGGNWREDARAYTSACETVGVLSGTEVSRSGEGAHVWIFFEQAVPAQAARSLGAALLRQAMTLRSSMNLDSYDRLFPAQDLLPTRSPGRMRLGNLIALPLQGDCRRRGTTVFVNPETWKAFEDQFAFLSSLGRVSPESLAAALRNLRLSGAEEGSAASVRRPTAAPAETSRPNTFQDEAGVTPLFEAGAAASVDAVRLRLGGLVSIPLAGLAPRLIAELKHAASIPNPEFYRKQAQRFSTFGTPRYVRCFEDDGVDLRMPRGLLESVQATLAEASVRSSVISDLPEPTAIAVNFQGELRPNQREAVSRLLKHDTGVLVAPPGAGKTVIACAMIAERRVPTAIVVNRSELAAQWRDRLTQYLDLEPGRIGQLGSGRRKRYGVIDIVMLQSISHRAADPTILDEYGQIIIDECHAVAAPAAEAAIRRVAARYWLGLTATPFRADQMDEIITMQCGPVRHEMPGASPGRRQLIRRETAFTTLESGTDGASIQVIYGELAGDAARNALIVNDILAAYRKGRRCLVLSNRVQHVNQLAESLSTGIENVHVLHGLIPAKERSATLQAIAANAEQPLVLVAIDKVAGEGLDLPGLDTLFLTVPVSFKGRVIQQIGRIARGESDSEPQVVAKVFDYHDALVPLLDRMYTKRRRVMEKEGYEQSPGATALFQIT